MEISGTSSVESDTLFLLQTPSLTDGATTLTGLKDILSYLPSKSKTAKGLLGTSKDDKESVSGSLIRCSCSLGQRVAQRLRQPLRQGELLQGCCHRDELCSLEPVFHCSS